MIATLGRRWPWLAALSMLMAVIVVFRSALIALVLRPIALLLWALWRILASVDQNVLWLILIGICSALVVRVVPLPRGTEDEVESEPGHGSISPSRLAHWTTVAAGASRGGEGRTALLLLVRNLAATVAEVTRLSAPSADRSEQPGRAESVNALLSRLVPGYRRRRETREIEELLNWMESALEISHDR